MLYPQAPINPDLQPEPMRSGTTRRALTRFGLWMAFALCFFQSVTVAVAWWTGELSAPDPLDWLWIALLPLLIGVYLRYFSVVGCGVDGCRLR
jgi:hypothetical protein